MLHLGDERDRLRQNQRERSHARARSSARVPARLSAHQPSDVLHSSPQCRSRTTPPTYLPTCLRINLPDRKISRRVGRNLEEDHGTGARACCARRDRARKNTRRRTHAHA
eukprot:4419102-Pleurochrysis_carterae.AAC.1